MPPMRVDVLPTRHEHFAPFGNTAATHTRTARPELPQAFGGEMVTLTHLNWRINKRAGATAIPQWSAPFVNPLTGSLESVHLFGEHIALINEAMGTTIEPGDEMPLELDVIVGELFKDGKMMYKGIQAILTDSGTYDLPKPANTQNAPELVPELA